MIHDVNTVKLHNDGDWMHYHGCLLVAVFEKLFGKQYSFKLKLPDLFILLKKLGSLTFTKWKPYLSSYLHVGQIVYLF